MKRTVVWGLALCVALGSLVCLDSNSASALPAIKTEFDNKYMQDKESALFKALDGKSNCNVCHVGKKDKKKRNAYGAAIDKLLEKDDLKEVKKPETIKLIQEALDKVAEESSNPDDKDAPTFGKLIEEGKLPVTADE